MSGEIHQHSSDSNHCGQHAVASEILSESVINSLECGSYPILNSRKDISVFTTFLPPGLSVPQRTKVQCFQISDVLTQ